MRRLLVSSLIIVLAFSLTSCSLNKEESSVVLSDKEQVLYDDYYENMERIESIFDSNGIKYEVVDTVFAESSLDDCKGLHYFTSDSEASISNLDYSLILESEDTVRGYNLFLGFNVKDDFNLEDTVVPEISRLLIGKIIDYSDVSSRIREMIKSATDSLDPSNVITNEYDNVTEQIFVDSTMISYSLIVTDK